MPSPVITILKIFGYVLIGLVVYNYINDDLGFTIANSVALVILGLCLAAIYQGYNPNLIMWVGWFFIFMGCSLIFIQTDLVWLFLMIAVISIIIGYRLAGFPFDTSWTGDGGGDGYDIDVGGD